MTNDTAAQTELPSAPAPALTTGGAPGLVLPVNAQPKAKNPMSLELESDKALRLRGGCGCIDGGIDVETGPCVCDADSYGCLGCAVACVVWIPNCVIGSILGVLDYFCCCPANECRCTCRTYDHY